MSALLPEGRKSPRGEALLNRSQAASFLSFSGAAYVYIVGYSDALSHALQRIFEI